MLVAALFAADVAFAQTAAWKEMHKVKRKETIFGIAKDNGLTVEELMEANPEMKQPGYKLKKGDFIFIPYPKAAPAPQAQAQAASAPQPPAPLHGGSIDRGSISAGGEFLIQHIKSLSIAAEQFHLFDEIFGILFLFALLFDEPI